MLRAAFAIPWLALVACGGSPAPASSVVSNTSARAAAPLSPRDALIARLHASHQVMGFDFSLLPLASFLQSITDAFPCVAPLIAAEPLVIIGGDEGQSQEALVANLDEVATTDCLAEVAPQTGMDLDESDGVLHVIVGPATYHLRWTDRILRITSDDREPTGSISPDLMDRIATIPTDAGFWTISSGYPKHQIASSHLWVRADAAEVVVNAVATGTTPGAAARWLGSIEEGFRAGVAGRGLELPADPFGKVTDNGISARLDARVPLSLFRPAGAP